MVLLVMNPVLLVINPLVQYSPVSKLEGSKSVVRFFSNICGGALEGSKTVLVTSVVGRLADAKYPTLAHKIVVETLDYTTYL